MLQPEEIEQIKTNILTRIEGQTEFGDMFYGMDTDRDNTNNMNWMQNCRLKSYKVIDDGIYDEYYPQVATQIDKINKIRGTNLYDIVPQLKSFIDPAY
jgi:hypothetical protein